MGTELTLSNQGEFASENQLVKQALQAPKIINALPYEIDSAMSVAIDKAILYLGLKTEIIDRDVIKVTAIDDVKRHFKLLTISELGIAIDNGVHGKYGAVVGLSPKDVYNWINAYSISNERRVNQELLQKEQDEPKEPTDEYKLRLYWHNLVNAWNFYKEKGYYDDFGNSVYNTLLINEKINFTVEQKEKFKQLALSNLRNQYNPLQHIGNSIKINEVRQILSEIEASNNNARLISEAKKIALNQFFKELLELDMNIEDLFAD